ncbi:ATP-binding protein [Dietzia sp. Die43]|uniref:ATP-binding protein n=1 Tax=Dietzia sp. Die43 TaxID=2926011 RepID=UPI002117D719|nr:SbcC/MukB-like Walker B domain-containing protein [Dietzia sp. Die43]
MTSSLTSATTSGLFSSVELGAGSRPGFRLARLEVLNWGTFDSRVWHLDSAGETLLLTGDIGSGKSTLVDAVSTLMLPSHRIDYNKAAGAARKERTLRSYVEGHHKTERNEATGTVRPVGLRDARSYSVILGVFRNEGYGDEVTLAQVFQQQDATGQPWRRFVTADRALSIEGDFTDFGTDLSTLLTRLKDSGAAVEKDFPTYGRAMRRLLGIRSEQAMELFHQTISMKSVGDLNEFVRTHMLEPADASARIEGILRHFEDLTRAHDAVKRARTQLDALEPLVEQIETYDAALRRRERLRDERMAIRPYYAELRLSLRQSEIDTLGHEVATAVAELARMRERTQELATERDGLVTVRAESGGNRVGDLERDASAAREQFEERRRRRDRFTDALHRAGLDPVTDEAGFTRLAEHVTARQAELDALAADLKTRHDALVMDHGERRRLLREVTQELESASARSSNIPAEQLQVRDQLCTELGVDAADLPFAGELMDVAQEHAQWRGAAERVLRGFAVSLLVPESLYAGVSEWVNSRRLTARRSDGREVGVRLVYERVPERHVPLQRPQAAGLLLADTIEIADSPLRGYLAKELYARADHRCADTMEEFRAADRAVTIQGQIRSRGWHVKDDRQSATDARGWVLGWRTEDKVTALRARRAQLEGEVAERATRLDAAVRDQATLGEARTALIRLAEYTTWRDLDWAEANERAESAEAERRRLVEGSSEMAEIDRRLADLDSRRVALAEDERELADHRSRWQSSIDHETRQMARDQRALAELDDELLYAAREVYPQLRERLGYTEDKGAEYAQTADEAHTAEQALADAVDADVERAQRELNALTTRIQQAMAEICRRWPDQTKEMDASIAARDEFVRFHARLADDDLPRFVGEFEEQLRKNTIRELAGFHNWLLRQADDIGQKIEKTNEALGAIDFNPGRYVRLDRENTVNQEVRQFRADLRGVTDQAFGGEGQYSEERYEQVRAILERLRGREGHSDGDRAWRTRVTDVRNWYTFSASERDRETDQEWEHYRDSDGKSGGQKEKLAYTILAASLAYQFGLEWGADKARDFRFAVIDEAFGRGSDSSTRYALELFAKLGIQLLIVTPLQKVQVIAPYVRSIGYVDNVDGRCSRLVQMTTEEYHKLRGGQ